MVAGWAAAAGQALGWPPADNAIGLVRCCQCGQPCRGGSTDYLGRFRCTDCARLWEGVEQARRQQQAQVQETERLALVAVEEAEREVMWSMPLR